jgi:hypothetical protein
VLGLVVALAAPIALVATRVPVVDKAAMIDTVSDPMAETNWHIPIGNKLTVGQRTTSASPGGLGRPDQVGGPGGHVLNDRVRPPTHHTR